LHPGAQTVYLDGLLEVVQELEVHLLFAGRDDRFSQLGSPSSSICVMLTHYRIHSPCNQDKYRTLDT